MTGRESTCRLGGCFEEGIEEVKSVITISVQTKLTPETKDTYFPHKAGILINKCNHGIHHIRAVTIQTGPQNETHHTATLHKLGVYTGLDKTFIILCLPTTKEVTLKTFPFPVPKKE